MITMEIWMILLTTGSAVLIALYYSLKKNNFFEKNGIIHPRGLPLLGNMGPLLFRRITISEMILNLYKLNDEAKYVGFYDFRSPVIVLRDLDLIKKVCIKNFDHFMDHKGIVDPAQEPFFANNLAGLRGQRWREIRNLLTPGFTLSKMKGMFKLMSDCAERFADYMMKESIEKPCISYNSKDIFTKYTADAIATCAFGIQVNSMEDPANDCYVLGKKSAVFEGWAGFKLFLMSSFPELAKILRIRVLDRKIEKFFTQLVQDTIETRDREGIYRPDMIQLMMESRNNRDAPTLTIQEMTSQAFVFFFGGFDSTSSAMCFVAHHIANEPKIQEKLQNEIDQVYENCDYKLTYDAINNMPYLDALIKESLRLYTIGVALDRVCTKEFKLPPALPGKKSVLLKPGDYLWIPVFALHMDPQFFKDPETFDPERFMDRDSTKGGIFDSQAYYPFGIGPRMCIGNRFALLEIKVLIFHLMLKCSLKISKKMIMPMRMSKSAIGFAPEGGFWLRIEPRKKLENNKI